MGKVLFWYEWLIMQGLKMSHFEPVGPEHASRLLYHGPTILVTSHDPKLHKHNVMAVGWSTAVNTLPSQVAVIIDKGAWTRELISNSGVFGICIPMLPLKDLTYSVGNVSGRNGDKFSRFSIPFVNSPTFGLPLIEQGCAAWLECRLIPDKQASEKFDTLFAQVIMAAADKRVFSNGHWLFNDENKHLRTLHYLGDGNFLTTGDNVKAHYLEM